MNEVFAEYFTNEFDDPLNAYTNSMANYSGSIQGLPPAAAAHAAATATGAQASNGVAATAGPAPGNNKGTKVAAVSLPTGGIKTAFHVGAGVPSRPAGVVAPPQKRTKQEEMANQGMAVPQQLGSAMSAQVAQLAMAHQQASTAAAAQLQQHFAAAQQMAAAQQQQTAVGASGVALPVGVGIRLGGVGGIAPSTAQNAPAMMQAQYAAAALWGNQAAMGASSEQAMAERRQRNREHAKRSRVRKKFMLESLQEQVRQLQLENKNLRMIVQEHIPTKAMSIIAECCTTSPLFAEGGVEKEDPTKLGKSDFSLMASLTSGQKCFVLSDPKLPDNPIVLASGDFYTMTGYTSKEVLGRNCRFLQGPGTDPRAVEVIRKAIATGSDATVCLLNYKADGTPFWNNFFIAALRDSDNNIVNYVSTLATGWVPCHKCLFVLEADKTYFLLML